MLQTNFRGVVVKEISFKEKDKIITVFAKEKGLIQIVVKGGRKAKMNLAGTSLFSYCDFEITNGKSRSLSYLKEVDVIKTFYNLTKNYENIFIATYLAEHCVKGLMEEENNDNILLLLISCLNQLDKGVIDNKIVLSIFELKFMQYSGYEPITTNCHICGSDKDLNYFNKEGVICKKCNNGNRYNIEINETILYTIKYILNNDKLVFSFQLDEKYVAILNKVTRNIIINSIEYNLKSINMV